MVKIGRFRKTGTYLNIGPLENLNYEGFKAPQKKKRKKQKIMKKKSVGYDPWRD